jgi:hypothetical protein
MRLVSLSDSRPCSFLRFSREDDGQFKAMLEEVS